ncbi:MAG: hypothetical protein ACXWT0_01655 [Methylobacter sp.]
MIVERMTGHDAYGQPVVSSTFSSRCSIVKLAVDRLKTSVRTDTSASGGNAHEIIADARLLAALNPAVEVGDRVIVAGVALRVDTRFVRRDVHGNTHHFQLDLSLWA